MRIYTSCWRVVAVFLSGIGGLVLVLTAGWWATVAVVASVALLAGTLAYSWRDSFGPTELSVVGWTAGSCAGSLLVVGLPLAAGRAAFLVFLVLGLTSPPLVRRLARHRGAHGRRPPAAATTQLQDPLLTLAWFDTTRRLRAAANPAEALAVVQERARLLDDLEQRDPDAFKAWLSSPVS